METEPDRRLYFLGPRGQVARSQVRRACDRSDKGEARYEEGKTRYVKRKGIVEPVNGWIKSVLGFRHFQPTRLAKSHPRVGSHLPGDESEALEHPGIGVGARRRG